MRPVTWARDASPCDSRAVKLDDSRRLFGPNVQLRGPGAIAEVSFEQGEDPEAAIAAWERAVAELVPGATTAVRRWRGGAALVIAGEHDQLLGLTEVNEHVIEGAPAPDLAAAIDPALRALLSEARRRKLPILVDDAAVSIGLGRRARVWERAALPAPDTVPWSELGRVPVAMVTGTNGKTTTVRIAARMAQVAALRAGVACTDGIVVRGELLHAGDYTGPEAARIVLRHPEVELAILETARGGILRRGLALDDVDAGVVTNVSSDHLGLYGVDDEATMAEVKATVARAGRVAILNGGDARLRGVGATLPRVVWFGAGGDWTSAGGWIARQGTRLLRVSEMPISFGGAAEHNVENALAAAALAEAIGVPSPAILEALRTFTSDGGDNPGRGNWHEVRGISVLLDFAHNPEGMRAMMAVVGTRRAPGARLHVVMGQPGDRRDDAIAAVAREVAAARPDLVLLHELTGYLRGREPGAVPALLRAELTRAGVQAIEDAPSETAGLGRALAVARRGDVIVVVPLLDAEGVRAVLEA